MPADKIIKTALEVMKNIDRDEMLNRLRIMVRGPDADRFLNFCESLHPVDLATVFVGIIAHDEGFVE